MGLQGTLVGDFSKSPWWPCPPAPREFKLIRGKDMSCTSLLQAGVDKTNVRSFTRLHRLSLSTKEKLQRPKMKNPPELLDSCDFSPTLQSSRAVFLINLQTSLNLSLTMMDYYWTLEVKLNRKPGWGQILNLLACQYIWGEKQLGGTWYFMRKSFLLKGVSKKFRTLDEMKEILFKIRTLRHILCKNFDK